MQTDPCLTFFRLDHKLSLLFKTQADDNSLVFQCLVPAKNWKIESRSVFTDDGISSVIVNAAGRYSHFYRKRVNEKLFLLFQFDEVKSSNVSLSKKVTKRTRLFKALW